MAHTVTLQPGYILHSRPYRDTSLLIEAFTPAYGRISLVARGARRKQSRLRGLLQPFRPLLISWSGRGELFTLINAEEHNIEERQVKSPLTGRAVLTGFYLNELLMRLMQRGDPHPAVFSNYHETLVKLAQLGAITFSDGQTEDQDKQDWRHRSEQLIRHFEKQLLDEMGYGLILDHDVVSNKPLVDDAHYRYLFTKGPEEVPAEAVSYGGQDIIVRGRTLKALANQHLEQAIELQEAKQLLTAVLANYLGDKPLNSRKLYQSFMAVAEKGTQHGDNRV